jgi:flavin-dependent dehydrogenase
VARRRSSHRGVVRRSPRQDTTIRYDAIVVGGGLVGTTTAYELGRGGARTLLVDRHDHGRATDAGAGILSPETEPELDLAPFSASRFSRSSFRAF